jgi:hypothetical protein
LKGRVHIPLQTEALLIDMTAQARAGHAYCRTLNVYRLIGFQHATFSLPIQRLRANGISSLMLQVHISLYDNIPAGTTHLTLIGFEPKQGLVIPEHLGPYPLSNCHLRGLI